MNKIGTQFLIDSILIEAEIHFRLLFIDIEKNGRRVMWKKNSLYLLKICLGTLSWGKKKDD